MDPCQAHNVPSSPSTIDSSQDGVEDLLEAADSVPLFPCLADADAQMVDQSCIPVIAEARAAEDYLTNWTRGRPDQDVVLDHVLGKLWPSIVVDALMLQLFVSQNKGGDPLSCPD